MMGVDFIVIQVSSSDAIKCSKVVRYMFYTIIE